MNATVIFMPFARSFIFKRPKTLGRLKYTKHLSCFAGHIRACSLNFTVSTISMSSKKTVSTGRIQMGILTKVPDSFFLPHNHK